MLIAFQLADDDRLVSIGLLPAMLELSPVVALALQDDSAGPPRECNRDSQQDVKTLVIPLPFGSTQCTFETLGAFTHLLGRLADGQMLSDETALLPWWHAGDRKRQEGLVELCTVADLLLCDPILHWAVQLLACEAVDDCS